jgi:acetyl-CoA synthetase
LLAIFFLSTLGKQTMTTIQSILSETRLFEPSTQTVETATIKGLAHYQALCEEAEKDYKAIGHV